MFFERWCSAIYNMLNDEARKRLGTRVWEVDTKISGK